ncbi:hypothetical protein NDU88_006001 [Pleurodeles waltl]|uniref:Uncharacterized protein n=1 Tax=Pleurodeles waltl TaxID=8319 RepID=A0AAV7QGU6_PLEWA|nr:hypothetical protein NDU88_006001 [Pleurodeles waltl]
MVGSYSPGMLVQLHVLDCDSSRLQPIKDAQRFSHQRMFVRHPALHGTATARWSMLVCDRIYFLFPESLETEAAANARSPVQGKKEERGRVT